MMRIFPYYLGLKAMLLIRLSVTVKVLQVILVKFYFHIFCLINAKVKHKSYVHKFSEHI